MKNNVQFLSSKLLNNAGIQHGWFMRYGGVSDNLFSSLNVKKGNGDNDSNVEENRRRALSTLFKADQSGSLAFITHKFKTETIIVKDPGEYFGYDASITIQKEVILAQGTADCGSVIVASVDGGVIALVHGSWHTLRDKIICDVVAEIKSHTSELLIAGIGPMICQNCYEFGSEAAMLFDKKYLRKIDNKLYVNLKQMIIDQLIESGVTKIDDTNICTFEDSRFFSHRRDGAKSGRYLTLAG